MFNSNYVDRVVWNQSQNNGHKMYTVKQWQTGKVLFLEKSWSVTINYPGNYSVETVTITLNTVFFDKRYIIIASNIILKHIQ